MSAALLLGALSSFFLSALVPVVNGEALLIGLVLAAPEHAVPLVVAGALGQMVGKAFLFLGAGGFARAAFRERLDRWRLQDRSRRFRVGLLFCSAAIGLPPFYAVTLVARSIGIRLSTFLAVGFAGRLVRFAALLVVPELLGVLGH